ncbi:protein transport protein [Salix suchowensis]|nr:protein transport protein [Salix suchowensis]
MGTENPGRPNPFIGSPFAAAPPPTATPFSASGPMVGSEASGSRPPAQPPQNTMLSMSSGSVARTQASGFRPNNPPTRFNADPLPALSNPQFPSVHQAPPSQAPPIGQPPFQPPAGQLPSPASFHLQPQVPVAPMGSPPSRLNSPQLSSDSSAFASRMNFQPSFPHMDSSYSAARATLQPSLPGYVKQANAISQASPLTPFQAQQGGYAAPTPPPPPPPPPFLLSKEGSIQHPGSAPPIGGIQGLAEDFSSLSLGSVPGSIDSGLDPKALPRPLDGDVEPNSLGDSYPMNCNPRYLRLTTSAVPSSQSLLSRWHFPLGAVVCPLAEAPDGEEVPVINFVSTGIIRCRRCRTYVNPYVTFTDSGRKWCCNICTLLNEVPGDYFAQLDATGRRIDLDQRPELTKGSVEFVAPTEYMVRPPMPPLYFFLIDVSVSAVRSGMIEVVAQTIKSCLDELPGYPRTQVGFITFDSTIHFYNMKSSLTQPQMMVVSDLDDIFVPLPDDLRVNLSESRSVVEAFLDSLPSMFQENVNVESALGPAVKATFMIMVTRCHLLCCRLKLRGDDPRFYGTDKEHALRIPEDLFYKNMAAECTKYQIGLMCTLSDKYTDIASLGALAKYSGGQIYHYPSFQSATHGEKLRHELARDLTRETAWEAVMRIRCGKGVRFTSYHGNFMLRSTDLLALPAVDCDKAYGAQLSLEETLLTSKTVYFQVVLLYTASCGERRIRIHTAAVPVVADLGEMYRHADTGAIVSLFARLAIEKSFSYKLEDARSSVQLRIVKALREYRNLYAMQHRLGGRMIYPEPLKFLPLYGLALCKSVALRGGYADVQLDDRCAAGFTMMALPVKKMLKLLYPSLVRADEYLLKPSAQANGFENIMKRLPLTIESLDSRGLYVYDDGFRFVVWFGRMFSPDAALNLLGQDATVEFSKVALGKHETEMSSKLMGLLKKLRDSDPSYYQLCNLVRQGEQPREGYLLLTNLVEDQIGGVSGYSDWMVQIHRQVQQSA